MPPQSVNHASNTKGKDKAPVPTENRAPPGSFYTLHAGYTPPTLSPLSNADRLPTPDIIELSSDVEEDTARNRRVTPIEIDDDDVDGKQPQLALPPKRSTTQTSASRVNGKRKHSEEPQASSGGAASGSRPGANGSGRTTRSSKRRAGEAPSGETIVID